MKPGFQYVVISIFKKYIILNFLRLNYTFTDRLGYFWIYQVNEVI
jgi:hypothetical protein